MSVKTPSIPKPEIYRLDNGYWGVVLVLPELGQHMRNDFETADDAFDWATDLRTMYHQMLIDDLAS